MSRLPRRRLFQPGAAAAVRLPAVLRCCFYLLSTSLLCGLDLRAGADETPAATAGGDTITSAIDFWRMPDAEKSKRHPVRLEFTVCYHDPFWQLLWGENEGVGTFVRLTSVRETLRSGQRIRVEGSVIPANGLSVDDERVTLLSGPQPVEVVPAVDLRDASRLDLQVVRFVGYVNRQLESDANHLTLEMAVDTQPVFVRVLIPSGRPVPQVEGSLLQVEGVYVASRDASGQLTQVDVWVAQPENLVRRSWLENDPRFDGPVVAIETLPSLPASSLVRVAGTIRSQEPGESITLRDGTGQVMLKTAQRLDANPGDSVEAVGYPATDGLDWELRQCLVRPARTSTPPPANRGLPRLRVTEQVRELSSAEAARGYPVRLTGVVTWSHPSAPFYFLQDSSGGLKVHAKRAAGAPPAISQRVTVSGVSASGDFAPELAEATVEPVDEIRLPEPRMVTLEQALAGVEEAQWVNMSGYVRDVRRLHDWSYLTLVTSVGEFEAVLSAGGDWQALRGSVIRVRGVCSALANTRRQLTGVQLWVGSTQHVEIEEPAPEDPFATPLRTIASLREHSTLRAAARRVRIAGTVVDHTPGRRLRILDGADSLLVFSTDPQPLALGDRVQVVGFPGRQSGRVVLREAVYRRESSGEEPLPRPLQLIALEDEHDGQLVRVEGRLLATARTASEIRLTIRSGEITFDALLEGVPDATSTSWLVDSRVALTGIYEILLDEHLQPQGVTLKLRSPHDVSVLARPSWWTADRAWWFAGTLGLGAVIGASWIFALRRQVRRQTEHIRTQVEKSAQLELELIRASKLESLGVLAGGIAHDFNNLLTVIMGNITLVLSGRALDEESEVCLRNGERAALRARDLTQQLLTFAKGGAPVRTSIHLPEIVREAAQFALHGSNVRCEFQLANDLWPADADKGQLSQVLHNLVLNAKQAMSSGGVVKISIQNDDLLPDVSVSKLAPGRYLRVSVSDHGAGISPEHLNRVFEPYFTTKRQGNGLGLATVHSIIKRHQGHIEVDSTPGVGTTFRFWLPASNGHTPVPAATPRHAGRKTGRVLFMDDEDFVRQVASTLLKRIGCEPTVVSDGTQAIEAFAAARQAGSPYHVVILDLTVPGGMGGVDTLSAIRRIDPEVRAIVSSGYSSDPVMANHRAYGFKAVVPKPYEAEDLMRAVQRLLSES